MKRGVRAVGIAESYRGTDAANRTAPRDASGSTSTLAAAVVRADRTVDGFAFGECTVGGTDATAAVIDLLDRLDRPDVRAVLIAGVAPAWFNLLDLDRIHDAVDRPVLAVSFEASPGLAAAIEREFDGDARADRLARYRRLPPRAAVSLDGETVFVQPAGTSAEAGAETVRAFTLEGGRPEPVRVARLAARAADRWRTTF